MKKIITLVLTILISVTLHAQWVQKTSLPAAGRAFAGSFTINNKIYLYGGSTASGYVADFWEYDPATDVWTPKATFPGGARLEPAMFSVGNKGYLSGGINNQTTLDIWEYDPAMDTWTIKNVFAVQSRINSAGFSIGNKGYIVAGQDYLSGGNSNTNFALNDLLEYDPIANTLTPKATIPGNKRSFPLAISVGNKGYVGLGNDVAGNGTEQPNNIDFYEYDPTTDTWTALTNFPGIPVSDMAVFTIGQKLYCVGGVNFPSVLFSPQVHSYDVMTNTWTQLANYGGSIVASCTGGYTSSKAYIGTGYDANFNERTDWWEFTPPITTGLSLGAEPNEAVSIYPNPCQDKITIKGKGENITQVKLFDALGKEVKVVYNTISRSLNLSELPEGIYNLFVYWDDGQVSKKKFSKNQ